MWSLSSTESPAMAYINASPSRDPHNTNTPIEGHGGNIIAAARKQIAEESVTNDNVASPRSAQSKSAIFQQPDSRRMSQELHASHAAGGHHPASACPCPSPNKFLRKTSLSPSLDAHAHHEDRTSVLLPPPLPPAPSNPRAILHHTASRDTKTQPAGPFLCLTKSKVSDGPAPAGAVRPLDWGVVWGGDWDSSKEPKVRYCFGENAVVRAFERVSVWTRAGVFVHEVSLL